MKCNYTIGEVISVWTALILLLIMSLILADKIDKLEQRINILENIEHVERMG